MNALEHLAAKECIPCKGDVPPLGESAWRALNAQLGHGWNVTDGHHLEKQYDFKDFLGALDFTNKVGAVAEAQQHHPDIYLTWGKVKLSLWTHKIDGLTESDFTLAAKIESISRAA